MPAIVVNDAWRRLPWADCLYAADAKWWRHHGGCPEFRGEKWSTHSLPENRKTEEARLYGLRLLKGAAGEGFATDPGVLHYGSNGGFQAINLALHFIGWQGAVILVGFDMRVVDGRRHFFGDHPPALYRPNTDYGRWFRQFQTAADALPPAVKVINCTPGSALPCFPIVPLEEAVECLA